jgi:hypothetical protein
MQQDLGSPILRNFLAKDGKNTELALPLGPCLRVVANRKVTMAPASPGRVTHVRTTVHGTKTSGAALPTHLA